LFNHGPLLYRFLKRAESLGAPLTCLS
jgi:hypothetical protein